MKKPGRGAVSAAAVGRKACRVRCTRRAVLAALPQAQEKGIDGREKIHPRTNSHASFTSLS